MQSSPYFRSPLARSIYARLLSDQHLRSLDKSKWYECNLSNVPPEVADTFILNHSDEETERFLEMCFQKSDWLVTQIFHAVAKVFLCWFMTKTSINGLLGRGSMFVFSKAQFQEMFDISLESSKTLLDIGAGDGLVTSVMADHFSDIYVTEVSSVMRKILVSKGYKLLEIDEWALEDKGPSTFDVISCLNVLDRCDSPLTMLQQMRQKLTSNVGRLVIAVVLPLRQYVEAGDDGHQPKERIPVHGETFEEQVTCLSTFVFPQHGFEVVKWTRLPYLCEGDMNQSFYWLNDAVFLLKAKTCEK